MLSPAAGGGSSLELCCPGSGGQAAPDVRIWGPLLAPLSLAGQRVGPRHSCGWEPRLEANGAAAAADATADAARPLHTHPPLPPPPASERAGGGRGQPRGGQTGGRRPGPVQWSVGFSGGRGEGGGGPGCCRHCRDVGSPGSRQDGRRERYVSVPGRPAGVWVRRGLSTGVWFSSSSSHDVCAWDWRSSYLSVCMSHCVSLCVCECVSGCVFSCVSL